MSSNQGLVFYEKSHRYKLDGKWVPGVTTLIKGGLPAPALVYWSARSVAEYVADHPEDVETLRRMGRGPMVQALKEVPWQKRDTAGERGTEVHRYTERILGDEEVDVPTELQGYVQGALDFMRDWQIEPLIVEGRVAHRAHWWAGTGDLWARYTAPEGHRLPNGVPATGTLYADWKTADSGIWPETAFQASAYINAEFYMDGDEEKPLPAVDFAAAVWLQPGEYQVIPVRVDAQVYKEFRHLAFVADTAKRAKGDKTTAGYVGQPIEPIDEGSAA